jgi:hypothetical protein
MRTWLALAASLSALALLPMLWSGLRQQEGLAPAAVKTIAPVRATPAEAQPAADATLRGIDRRSAKAMPSASSERPAPSAANRTATATATAMTVPVVGQAVADQTGVGRAIIDQAGIARATLDAAPQLADVSAPASANAPLREPATVETAANRTATDTSPAPSPNNIASASAGAHSADATEALPPNAVLVGDTDADATTREMEMLYAASAQLETLLTYTRDPRVETGPAAALSSEIHTRLAKIDARLAQPGLSSNEQFALWHARVGTLRQAVAVESELRALSAEGRGYEGKLVEVY